VAEKVYQGLTGSRSVHMTDWPSASDVPADADLVRAMDEVRAVCSATLGLRKTSGRRVRLPLARLTVASPLANELQEFVEIIRDEVNVREVVLTSDVEGLATRELHLVPATLGPRLGKDTQKVIGAAKKGDWSMTGDAVVVGGVALVAGEFELRLSAKNVTSTDVVAATLAGGAGIVLLDIALTSELIAEGVARDLVRVVQQARRDAGLAVSDRIILSLGLPPTMATQVQPFLDHVIAETLAVKVEHLEDGRFTPNGDVDGVPVYVAVERVR
jgi:isoleucyl-tRNA synthetase